MSNGGWFGSSLGIAQRKITSTPHTGFIFSIIGEELGFYLVLYLYYWCFYLFFRGIKIAKKCTDHLEYF